MKKFSNYIILLLAIVGILQGCTKEYETVFQESSDERVQKAIEGYRAELLSAENGWKGYIYTGTGPGFVFYMDFKEDGYVTMISDFNETTGGTVKTSTYAMKGLQQPTLSFDTYTYIHLLADPSNSVNGGENGTGLISDFEFYLESSENDSLRLVGIKNNIPMILVKATASEESKFLNGDLGEKITNTSNYFDENPYPWLQLGNTQLAVVLDSTAKVFSLGYLNQSDDVIALSSLFTYSLNGLYLRTPLTFGNTVIEEILWDNTAKNFYILNNGQKIFFQESDTPVIPLVHALGFLHQYIVMDESIDGYTEKLPPAFVAIYNAAKDGVFNVGDYKLELFAFLLEFDQSNTVNMYYFIRNNTGTYRAGFQYTMNVSNDGKATFSFLNADPNGQVISDGLAPLLNYWKDNTFAMDYHTDVDFGTMAGIYPEQIPDAYFYGLLE
jgi:hypothetical protein